MALRRPRTGSALKPAPVAGLMLYVAPKELWNDWVRLVFAEKDINDSRVERIMPGRPNEDLLVLNPEQRLPALADRDVLLTGPRVIAEYLEERYPHPRLMPTDPAGRARVRMALDRFEQELFPMLVDARGERAAAKAARAALMQTLVTGARWFGARGYFVGLEYSVADAAWALWLQGVFALGLVPPDSVRQYAEKLAKRPAIMKLFSGK